jgi:PKD repeat protein
MRLKSKNWVLLFVSVFIFFAFSNLALGQANVSRSPSTQSISPRIAIDSAGNVHVVWAEYYTPIQDSPSPGSGDAFYSKYDVGTQQWSAPLNLSNSGRGYSPECRPVGIAIDGSNNIYVVYTEETGIVLRVYSGGSWSSPFEIATTTDEVDGTRIGVTSGGDIFTCWWLVTSGVVQSRARVGGTWESVKQLSSGGRRNKFCNLAASNNVAYACWMEGGWPNSNYQVAYVRRNTTLNASWTTPQRVAPMDTATSGLYNQQPPDVAIDSNDIAHVVWTTKMTPGTEWQLVVHYSYWTGSGFSSPLQLSQQTLLLYAQVFVRGGNVYTCWSMGAWGHGNSVHYNNRINGNWSGDGIVPNAKGSTFTDVATSPDQSKIYYVWDDMGKNPQGTWEVYCNIGQTGPPPPPPDNPVASFTASPSSGSPPLTVTFDGSSSYDVNGGTIVSYSWSFGDGATGSGQIVQHTYTSGGNFTARLTVTDNDGKTATASRTISLIKTNEPPVAEFSFSPTTGIFPLQVNFDASASRDPDGNIVQYSWDFGDGQTGGGRSTSHVYTRPGTFLISLTVRDNSGATASKSKTITVLGLQPPLHISWAIHADQSLFRTRYVTVVTWDKNPANDDLGVQIALYRIYRKKTSENNKAYAAIGDVTGDTFSFMDKNGGGQDVYSYTVTALDNKGHESPLSGAAAGFTNPLQNNRTATGERKGKIIR